MNKLAPFLWAVLGVVAIALAVRFNQSSPSPSIDVANGPQVEESEFKIRVDPIEMRHGKTIEGIDLIRVKRCLERLSPQWEMFKVYKVSHALEMWGRDVSFEKRFRPSEGAIESYFANSNDMIDVFTSTERHRQVAPGEGPLLFKTSSGVGVRNTKGEFGFQGSLLHDDTLLSTLADAGVGTGRKLELDDEGEFTVRDIVQHSMKEILLNREYEWTCNALLRYLVPLQTTWTTANGQVMNFDIIANLMLDREMGVGTCYGIHSLYSLCILYRLDEIYNLLKDETRTRVRARLLSAKQRLIETQNKKSGAWPAKWADAVTISKSDIFVSWQQTDFQELSSTSHHLEWLSVAPQEFRPPESQILKAIDYFLTQVENTSDGKLDFFYIQYTHGGRGICQLAGTAPGILLEIPDTDIKAGRVPQLPAFE